MSDYQDELAEQRLIAAIRAVGAAIEHAEMDRGDVGSDPSADSPQSLVHSLVGPARPEPARRSFHAALIGMAALLIIGVVGIVLLVGRAGQHPVQPGGGLVPSQSSSITGVPPATTTPPGPSRQLSPSGTGPSR